MNGPMAALRSTSQDTASENAEQDFSVKFNRSYFETSHAKSEQDVAGGLIKKAWRIGQTREVM